MGGGAIDGAKDDDVTGWAKVMACRRAVKLSGGSMGRGGEADEPAAVAIMEGGGVGIAAWGEEDGEVTETAGLPWGGDRCAGTRGEEERGVRAAAEKGADEEDEEDDRAESLGGSRGAATRGGDEREGEGEGAERGGERTIGQA